MIMLKCIKKLFNKRKESNYTDVFELVTQVNEQHKKLIDAQIDFQDRKQEALDPFGDWFEELLQWVGQEKQEKQE
jgi:hypothetical protein